LSEFDSLLYGDEAQDLDALADFSQPTQPKAPKSSKNKEAYTAVMSNDVGSISKLDGQSAEGKQVLQDIKLNGLAAAKTGLQEFMLDPSISDEEKLAVTQELTKQDSPAFDTGVLAINQAIEEPSPEESAEEEEQRMTFTDFAVELNEWEATKQSFLNSAMADLDGNDYAVSFLEMLRTYAIPFTNNIQQRKIYTEMAEAVESEGAAGLKAFILPGSGKMDIKQLLMNVPIEQRPEFTRLLIDIVYREQSILLPMDNEFFVYDQLRDMLEDGTYTNTGKWLDNAGTLLDAIPFVRPLRGRCIREAYLARSNLLLLRKR